MEAPAKWMMASTSSAREFSRPDWGFQSTCGNSREGAVLPLLRRLPGRSKRVISCPRRLKLSATADPTNPVDPEIRIFMGGLRLLDCKPRRLDYHTVISIQKNNAKRSRRQGITA